MDRRDFLHPRRIARAAGHVLGALQSLDPLDALTAVPAAAPRETVLLRLSRRAMATAFEIVLPFGGDAAMTHGEAAFDLIDDLESQLTVYRDNSEVSRLNRTAFAGPVPVEDGLFRLLELAARISAETDGAFDVTAGALIKAWGFFRGPRRVPPDAERAAALARVGMQAVELDAARQNRAVSTAGTGNQSRLDRQGLRPGPRGRFPGRDREIPRRVVARRGQQRVR